MFLFLHLLHLLLLLLPLLPLPLVWKLLLLSSSFLTFLNLQ